MNSNGGLVEWKRSLTRNNKCQRFQTVRLSVGNIFRTRCIRSRSIDVEFIVLRALLLFDRFRWFHLHSLRRHTFNMTGSRRRSFRRDPLGWFYFHFLCRHTFNMTRSRRRFLRRDRLRFGCNANGARLTVGFSRTLKTIITSNGTMEDEVCITFLAGEGTFLKKLRISDMAQLS